MDGIDAAVVETDGRDQIRYGPVWSLTYPPETQTLLRDARGWMPQPDAEIAVIEWHGPRLRQKFAPRVDLIGFHGQTVAHDPRGGRTRQLGDGQALARAWGVPVVWDFRSADMAAGGEGAPLAPFFHFHALRAAGLRGRVAVVNIGGVGNVTWADLDAERAEVPGAILGFDTGPGNALLDDMLRARGIADFDRDGMYSIKGQVDRDLVDTALGDEYFNRPAPKSLDRDAFAGIGAGLDDLAAPDAAATLVEITAASIARAGTLFPEPVSQWLITGGGRRNPTIMARLKALIAAPVMPIDQIGLNGDMLEAQTFAWLAVRNRAGLPLSAPGTTGCRRPVTGGRYSAP